MANRQMKEGRKLLQRRLRDVLGAKLDKPRLYPGLLGAYKDRPVLEVEGRPDFVWVRIRGVNSEPIQAFNDKVLPVFDLPVLVKQDAEIPNRWVIEGRDISQYQDWGGEQYLPRHGKAHSFAGVAGAGGDIVWVYKRQFMPRPANTCTNSIYVSAGYYYANETYHWWPGSGSATFDSYFPTGGNNARFVTVYIDISVGILQYVGGDEFNAYDNLEAINKISKIALPSPSQGIPICAVYLTTGSNFIGWNEIYDLRLAPTTADASSKSSGSAASIGHGIPTPMGSISGTYWQVPGGEYSQGTLLVYLNGVAQRGGGVDYQEQHAPSGTYQYTESPPTGTVHYVSFGHNA
jgi:hypothetical protein